MTRQPTISDAIIFATQSHDGQMDKNGRAYIYHPLRVMLRLNTDIQRMTAVLHDVLEDCWVTVAELKELQYPDEVITALDYLTKRSSEENDYAAFVERIRTGPTLAIEVKLADLADNLDPTRRTGDDEKTRRREEKYHRAVAILLDELKKR